MKKLSIITIILAVFALSSYVGAGEIKLGYVDLQKAFIESSRGTEAKKIFDEMMKTKQSAIDKTGKEIEKLQEEIEKQASALTTEAKKEKEEKRDKLVSDYQRLVKDSQKELKKKEAELSQEILKDLKAVINKIGEEENYTVIFEESESGMLYAPQRLNITEKVITKYNETTKTKTN
ncbi:MAG: OmpH family outer membrane protein [Nitrospirae bacterium]|nr:OmpH family outer membrane protein [Nitrospirota bacterium]